MPYFPPAFYGFLHWDEYILHSTSFAQLCESFRPFTRFLLSTVHKSTELHVTMGLPDHVQAVTAKDDKPIVSELPLPKLRDDYVLVKVNAVGLNPTDWKHAEGGGGYSAAERRIGCDYAGVVEEIGPKVSKKWKQGDRIAGFVHGA
jgi:hypothetical protein